MPEEPEIPTDELQERIHEASEHHAEAGDKSAAGFTRMIALSTAIFAVFAAVGALQSGALEEEATHNQLKASDTWNEYQADKVKIHLSELGIQLMAPSATERISSAQAQIQKETKKTNDLAAQAKDFEKESARAMNKRKFFAYQVALLQVAIALGAIAALTRVKWIWAGSMAVGLIGIALFLSGFIK